MAKELLKSVQFYADADLLRVLKLMQTFYGLSTLNKLFPRIVFAAAQDVASFPEDPNWSAAERHAWSECQLVLRDFGDAIVLQAAKRVLQKQPIDLQCSLDEFHKLIEGELAGLTKGKSKCSAQNKSRR